MIYRRVGCREPIYHPTCRFHGHTRSVQGRLSLFPLSFKTLDWRDRDTGRAVVLNSFRFRIHGYDDARKPPPEEAAILGAVSIAGVLF